LRRWRSLCVAPYDYMDMARDWHDAQVDHITPFSMHDLRGRRGARQQAARPARAQRERPRPRVASLPRARPLPAFHRSPQRLTDSIRLSQAAGFPKQPAFPSSQLSQAAGRRAGAARARRCSSTRWSWRGRAWRPTPAAGARRARTRACCTACRRPRAWRACPVRPRAARQAHARGRGACSAPGGRAWRAHQACARARCNRWSSCV